MSTQIKYQKRAYGWWIRKIFLITLIFLAGVWGAGALIKSNLMERYQAPGQMIDVGGYQMHIFCTGQGNPTILLASGLDDFSIFCLQVQPEISKSTRVCSYDRAGLGWSEPSPNSRTSEIMVEELHTLLVNANIDAPYVMVGHSFGGALMRLYTHNYPEEVVGLVLVDAAPDDLFIRIPSWRNAINGKLGLYHTLVPMSSFGLLAFTPGSIPNRGMPTNVLAQYRAIAVSTSYFQTGVAENEEFENNLAEVRAEHVNLGDLPLIVVSRGYWDPMPGFSEVENQQAWQMWQEMQIELLSLSSNSRQIVATESEHNIQLHQPELVIDAIREVVDMVEKKEK